MEFIYGAIGAFMVIAMIALGMVLGWKLRKLMDAPKQTAPEIPETQRQFLKDQQEAWNAMMDYNPETAYGMNKEEVTSGK